MKFRCNNCAHEWRSRRRTESCPKCHAACIVSFQRPTIPNNPASRFERLLAYLNTAHELENRDAPYWPGTEPEGKGVEVETVGCAFCDSFTVDPSLIPNSAGRVNKSAARLRAIAEARKTIIDFAGMLHMRIHLRTQRQGTTRVANGLEAAVRKALLRLKSYADSWLECSPNAQLWQERYPNYWRDIGKTLKRSFLIQLPTQKEGMALTWDNRPASTYQDAARRHIDKLFADFQHESYDKLGICKSCGRYFERTSKRTDYCSMACGHANTSRAAQRNRTHLKCHRRLADLRRRIQALRTEHTPEDLFADNYWKEAVRNDTCRANKRRSRDWLSHITIAQDHVASSGCRENCEACEKAKEALLNSFWSRSGEAS